MTLLAFDAAAGITITKCKMIDKTNGGEVTSGLADADLSVDFVAEATTDCKDTTLTYTWDFGDGTTAMGASVSHTYGDAGAGERSPSVTVTDTCGGSETQGGLSVSAIADIDVTLIGDVANPTNDGRICFDAVRDVTASALPAGVSGSDKIDWSLQVGLVHSRTANMDSGDLNALPSFPDYNSFWGPSTLYISIDGPLVPGQQGELILTGTASYIPNDKSVKVFFDQLGTQNPSTANPKPKNWFFYWTQTSANKGSPNYVNGNGGGYVQFTDNPNYRVYIDDGCTGSYTTPQVGQNANTTLTHIDNFAWTVRHEYRHHEQGVAWWGAGGYNGADDGDGDNMKDSFEGAMGYGAADGGPFDDTDPDTFNNDGNLVNDTERHAVFTQENWNVGSADGDDWAHPGNQWP